MRSRWSLAIGATSVVLSAAGAEAQDKATEAQERFNEGVKAFKHGEYEHARLLFLQSDALVHRGSVLRNLGLAEMELHRPLDALRHLRAALALSDLDGERRRVTDGDVRDAYAATGHIEVDTNDGSTVSVDGELVEGKAPFKDPIDVMPGRHVLEGNLASKTARTEVDAKAGILVAVNLMIDTTSPAPSAVPSPAPPALRAGPAITSLRTSESPSPPKREFWSGRRELGAGVAAVGFASTIAGLYFYTQAVDAQNRANSARAGLSPWSCNGPVQPEACTTANDAWSAQSTDATLNYVFMGLGAAGLLAGAALFLWPDMPSPVSIAPAVSPRGGGLHLRGEF